MRRTSKPASYSDSATLRHVATGSFRESVSGSGYFGGSQHTAPLRPTSSADGDEDENNRMTVGGLRVCGVARAAYLLQYFAVGLIYGGLPATTYGFLLGYLNVPSYVYSSCGTVLTLPWSFKFVMGAMNDCVPIAGLRRKPYMVFGWSLCCAMLLVLYWLPLPAPYYCIDPTTGKYLVDTNPCNPSAAHDGGVPSVLMSAAAVGYVIADVAADGLTVQYARAEPEAQRGYTQSTVYMVRSVGQIAAYALVGLGMNGHEYLGSFDWSLTFNQVCLVFALASGIMVPVAAFGIEEPRVLGHDGSFAEYWQATWTLLKSKAFFYVVLWQFFNPAIQYVKTTAANNVQKYWAGVETLQTNLFNMIAFILFALVLWVVRARFLNVSWRLMLATTTVVLVVLDMPFSLLTIFGVVRNQYFYLGDTVLSEIPEAAFFVVSCFVIVELAEDRNSGLVYGLLSTISNLGKGMPSAISNEIFAAFHPALSDSANYIAARGGDQLCFRRTVAWSFAVSYGFAFASLLTLPLMPDQKADAQRRMREWPHATCYAVCTLLLVGLSMGYSLTINFLSLTPLACLPFVGGEGCGANATSASSFNATAC